MRIAALIAGLALLAAGAAAQPTPSAEARYLVGVSGMT